MTRFILLSIILVNTLASCGAQTAVPGLVESFRETTVPTDSTPTTLSDGKLDASPESTTTMDVLQKWKHFENITKIFAKKSIKGLLPGLMEGMGKLNISASCQRDGFRLLVGLRDIKTWAFSFLDASGKFIDGMLSGTMSNIGEYDQCLAIQATEHRRGKNLGKVLFTGQYCALDIKPPLPPKKKYYKLNEVVDELKEFSEGGNVSREIASFLIRVFPKGRK